MGRTGALRVGAARGVQAVTLVGVAGGRRAGYAPTTGAVNRSHKKLAKRRRGSHETSLS